MACVIELFLRQFRGHTTAWLLVFFALGCSLHSQAPVTPEPATAPTTPDPARSEAQPTPGATTTDSPEPAPEAPALPPPPPPPSDEEMAPSDNPDDQVRFRFTFEGDNSPPSIGSKPDLPPPPPPPVPEVNPSDYLGHDPNDPVTYSLDDDEVEKPKKPKSKVGMQWDLLMAEFGKFGNWYLANVIWTGPTSGVLAIGMVTLLVVSRIKRKKQLQAIQEKFAQRSQNRPKKFAGGPKLKKSAKAPAGKKAKGPSKPPPVALKNSPENHLFLCFTGYDEKAAQIFKKRMIKAGYAILTRNMEKGSTKIFDIETVDMISSSRAVLLLASASAYTSERVQQETEHARDEEKAIVPVYLDQEALPNHFSYLGEDPDYVYFNPDDAKNSIIDVVDFLQSKDLPPA